MSTSTVKILCGSCKVPLEGPADAKDEDLCACPRCGRSDNLKNIMREVADHVHEMTARHIQESTGRTLGRSKFVEIRHKPIPKRTYRFISDLKL